eukprot:CAMPEP_0174277470 /NCGR_PEP_ID=MMETSP0439-20130205/60948_1 /TAXON_ID=0 /ORGANISM="Stereomyxa ramosa, Strain Chinc5" /LENGTH=575 /DNA_ID=CAMNT_0015369793 /DNA_START=6 /DNA_END=1735 /DNA_ORIENTATION=+
MGNFKPGDAKLIAEAVENKVQIVELSKELKHKNELLINTSRVIKELEQERDSFSIHAHQELQQENLALREELEENSKVMKNELEQQQQENTDLRSETNELKITIEHLHSQNKNLLEKKQKRPPGNETRIKQLQDYNKTLEEEKQEQTEQIQNLKVGKEKIEELERKNEELERKNVGKKKKELERKNKELERKNKELESGKGAVEKEKQAAVKDLVVLHKKIKQAEAKNKILIDTVSELEENLNQNMELSSSYTDQLSELKLALSNSSSLNSQINKKNSDLEEQLQQLKTQVREYRTLLEDNIKTQHAKDSEIKEKNKMLAFALDQLTAAYRKFAGNKPTNEKRDQTTTPHFSPPQSNSLATGSSSLATDPNSGSLATSSVENTVLPSSQSGRTNFIPEQYLTEYKNLLHSLMSMVMDKLKRAFSFNSKAKKIIQKLRAENTNLCNDLRALKLFYDERNKRKSNGYGDGKENQINSVVSSKYLNNGNDDFDTEAIRKSKLYQFLQNQENLLVSELNSEKKKELKEKDKEITRAEDKITELNANNKTLVIELTEKRNLIEKIFQLHKNVQGYASSLS